MESHPQSQISKIQSYPLHRHDIDYHDSQEKNYKTLILHTEKNLLPLCIAEGYCIDKQDPSTRINERN